MIQNCPYRINCNGIDCNKDFCMKKYRIDTLYENSLIPVPERQVKRLFTDADGTDLPQFQQLAQIENSIIDFVKAGHNLYLHSYTCGNGKTSWALRFLNTYIYKIWPKSNLECQVLYVEVSKYLQGLKDKISGISRPDVDFITQNVLKADLVVWDDIAAKAGTEFELNHLLNTINARMANKQSNIFTTNLGKRELAVALGERLASRVCNNSIDIELNGADKRYLGNKVEGGTN
jgi:DNA replication protein DnaC